MKRHAFQLTRTFKLCDKVSYVTIFHGIGPVRLHLRSMWKVNIDCLYFIWKGRMAVISSDSMAGRSVLGLARQVSEFIYVCAIYLGIAVLITVEIGRASCRERVCQYVSI